MCTLNFHGENFPANVKSLPQVGALIDQDLTNRFESNVCILHILWNVLQKERDERSLTHKGYFIYIQSEFNSRERGRFIHAKSKRRYLICFKKWIKLYSLVRFFPLNFRSFSFYFLIVVQVTFCKKSPPTKNLSKRVHNNYFKLFRAHCISIVSENHILCLNHLTDQIRQ